MISVNREDEMKNVIETEHRLERAVEEAMRRLHPERYQGQPTVT
jgi:hypothetical protein